jgi:magnesium transporter
MAEPMNAAITSPQTEDRILQASKLTAQEIRRRMAHEDKPFWVDIDSTDLKQHALLTDAFTFHLLAIEDTLNPHTRVKIEEYEGYLFVVLRAMRFDPEAPFEAHELAVKKLCLFIGANYLVTVHAGTSSSVTRARRRFEADPSLLQREGPGRVAHLICDEAVDAYFPILDQVDEIVDRLEHSDMDQLNRKAFNEILRVRRLAFAARRSILPQRAIFDVLAHRSNPLISTSARTYFRDVFDHAQRITESLDAYRELIANTTDSYVARSSMRMDYAAQIFSAIATLVLPFFVISEFYGMNVRGLPLSSTPGAFWLIVTVEVALSAALFAFIRWRRLV